MLELPLSVITVATLAAETAPRALGNGPDLTRYLLVCVGLISFVVFGGWAFRRLFKRVLVGKAARRSLQIVDLLPMGGKQRVAVVRCYDRTFALGQPPWGAHPAPMSSAREYAGVVMAIHLPCK